MRRGEDKWIFPYQENADAMFNSAMLYELAALRKFAEPILAQVPESSKANAEAYRLLRFLRYFNYIPDVGLPGTSLLREFLGGGSFRYWSATTEYFHMKEQEFHTHENIVSLPWKFIFPQVKIYFHRSLIILADHFLSDCKLYFVSLSL